MPGRTPTGAVQEELVEEDGVARAEDGAHDVDPVLLAHDADDTGAHTPPRGRRCHACRARRDPGGESARCQGRASRRRSRSVQSSKSSCGLPRRGTRRLGASRSVVPSARSVAASSCRPRGTLAHRGTCRLPRTSLRGRRSPRAPAWRPCRAGLRRAASHGAPTRHRAAGPRKPRPRDPRDSARAGERIVEARALREDTGDDEVATARFERVLGTWGHGESFVAVAASLSAMSRAFSSQMTSTASFARSSRLGSAAS